MGDIIEDAIAAIKADMDITDLTDFILQPKQQDMLMEAMEVQTRILPNIRSVRMERPKEHIDSIQFYGRVTHAGSNADGSIRVITDSDKVQVTGEHNILDAKELTAATAIRDRALRRVIGQQRTAPFIVNLLGNAAGRDFEELAIFGNRDIEYADDDVLCQTDGFAKKANNHLFGVGLDKDFDPADDLFPFNMFDEMINAMPNQYLDDLTNYRFLIDWDTFNKALDLWGLRNTAMGDQALSSGVLPAYKGIKPVYIPLMNRAKTAQVDLDKGHLGGVSILSNLLNMNWGIFHEVTLEPKRVPEGRATEWYLSYEGDVQYQERGAAVTSFLDIESL